MASSLRILKSVLNINRNYIHVSTNDCEEVLSAVYRRRETYVQKPIHVHARPYKRKQCLCPRCMKICPEYNIKISL